MVNATFSEAVRQAIDESMQRDSSVILMGLGVTDPKAIFGTTKGFGTQHMVQNKRTNKRIKKVEVA